MTIIEFIDKNPLDNMASTLLCKPEKVIFAGSDLTDVQKRVNKFKAVAGNRGLRTVFECVELNPESVFETADLLEKITKENAHCVFDIKGGEEYALVALGMVKERCQGNVHLRTFSAKSNMGFECDAYGCIRSQGPLELTVDENIILYGGRVIYTDEKGEGTVERDFNNGYCNQDITDIAGVWRSLGAKWNVILNSLDRINKYCRTGGRVWVNKKDDKKRLESQDFELVFESEFLEKLAAKRIISNLNRTEEETSFIYRNFNVINILSKVGNILELYTALEAFKLTDENGLRYYNDVKAGVFIDWDGKITPHNRVDVSNEIDVMLMKGTVPVFVSCKNGSCSIDELYKLSQVAEQFGGKYACKALVTANFEKNGITADYIRARAKDMGIRIIENINRMQKSEIEKELKNLCNPLH